MPRSSLPTPCAESTAVMVHALVERRSDDCEALFEHYRGAGDSENASIQAGLAAAKAGTALAFDRAAFFYRQALALSAGIRLPPRHGGKDFANALANAGRPAEAAEAYLRAAAGAGLPSEWSSNGARPNSSSSAGTSIGAWT